MPKLCKIIAVETSVKTRVETELTEAHKALQKSELFNGLARRYSPRDDDPSKPAGEKLPDEDKKVQFKAEEIIRVTGEKLTELFDVNAVREYGNTSAKADVIVDGVTLLTGVPVTYLLFLEKKLVDMLTFVRKLPVLDAGENWTKNEVTDLWASGTAGTARTKKVVRPLVLAEATKEHPAQVKETTEDVFVGTWETTKYSSAITAARQNELIRRVVAMQKAVKFAREEANSLDVPEVLVGGPVFKYLFA